MDTPITTLPDYGASKQKEKANMQYVNPEDDKAINKLSVKEQLQRTARAVHDDFVASAIDKIEEAARNGFFEVSMTGSSDEIDALVIYCIENDLAHESQNVIGSATQITIQWHDR